MALPEFDEALAKKVVSDSLLAVGDFPDPDDIGNFPFRLFNDYHKRIFLANLKLNVLKIKDNGEYYDVILNEDLIDGWTTLQDCINYVKNNKMLRFI